MNEVKTPEGEKPDTQPEEKLDVMSLRTRTRNLLRETIQEEGSMLTDTLTARIMDVTSKSIYRWKTNNPAWLPSLEHCPKIITFCEDVSRTRAAMFELFTGFPSIFKGVDNRTIEIVFGPVLAKLLTSKGDAVIRERAEGAALYVLMKYAEKLKEQRELKGQERAMEKMALTEAQRDEMAETLSLAPDWKTPPTKDEE